LNIILKKKPLSKLPIITNVHETEVLSDTNTTQGLGLNNNTMMDTMESDPMDLTTALEISNTKGMALLT